MGLDDLAVKNQALLSKWWRRFNAEPEAVWRKILTDKYNWVNKGMLHEFYDDYGKTSKVWWDIMLGWIRGRFP